MRPMLLMGQPDTVKTVNQRPIVSELLQPLLTGAQFYVQHGKKPLLCTFSLDRDMTMLKWVAQTIGSIGGNIRITQILAAHRNDENPQSMELTLSRITCSSVNPVSDKSSTVVLRLRALSTEQCLTWISGIYYLRSICPQEFYC